MPATCNARLGPEDVAQFRAEGYFIFEKPVFKQGGFNFQVHHGEVPLTCR